MSEPMTPGRLAEIRGSVVDGPVFDGPVFHIEQDRRDLLAEVDRLREGIEALSEDCRHHNLMEGDAADVRTERGWVDVLDVCTTLLGEDDGTVSGGSDG